MKIPVKKVTLFLGGNKERQDITILRAGRSRERSGTSWPFPRRFGERRTLDNERRAEHSRRHDL